MTSWRTHRRGGPPCWDRGGLTGPGGCGLGSGAKDSGPAAAGRTPGEKIELTFWSWVPGVDKAVDLWNSEHPDVKVRSEEHTSELQSRGQLVCRLLLEKKK